MLPTTEFVTGATEYVCVDPSQIAALPIIAAGLDGRGIVIAFVVAIVVPLQLDAVTLNVYEV